MDGELVKRRTRLRKLGLPADPEPQVALQRTGPSYYELALALHAEITRTTFMDPARYVGRLDVLDDCRTFGISETVKCLHQLGMTPSEFRGRMIR